MELCVVGFECLKQISRLTDEHGCTSELDDNLYNRSVKKMIFKRTLCWYSLFEAIGPGHVEDDHNHQHDEMNEERDEFY